MDQDHRPSSGESTSPGPPAECPLSVGWYAKVIASMTILALFLTASIRTALSGNSITTHTQPWPGLSSHTLLLCGQILAITGLLFYSVSYINLRGQIAGPLGRPGALAMSGFPWRRIRHPMYLADLVWLLGFALMAGLPASLSLWLIVVTGVWIQVQTEEKYLLDRFPKEFPEWKTRSGRLLPIPGW